MRPSALAVGPNAGPTAPTSGGGGAGRARRGGRGRRRSAGGRVGRRCLGCPPATGGGDDRKDRPADNEARQRAGSGQLLLPYSERGREPRPPMRWLATGRIRHSGRPRTPTRASGGGRTARGR